MIEQTSVLLLIKQVLEDLIYMIRFIMTDDQFDKFVNKLEKKRIKRDSREHNLYIVDLFQNPQN